jgi:hypothetical protein
MTCEIQKTVGKGDRAHEYKKKNPNPCFVIPFSIDFNSKWMACYSWLKKQSPQSMGGSPSFTTL